MDRVDRLPLDAHVLQIEVDAAAVSAQELERAVELDGLARDLPSRVREGEVETDVELDEVGAGRDSRLERRERVLRRDRGRAAMADHERPPAVAATQVHRAYPVRLTTIAQSSVSSPPPNERHSSSTPSASSCAPRFDRAASAASRRSIP